MTKKQTIGLIMLIAPIPVLIVVLGSYAISSFVISSLIASGEGSDLILVIGNLFSTVLGFAGIFAVIGILLMPVGVILLVTGAKKESDEDVPAAKDYVEKKPEKK